MANITLTTYFVGNELPENTNVPVGSAPLPRGLNKPQGRFIALYGSRDTLSGLQTARLEARRKGLKIFSRIDIQIDGGKNPSAKIGLDDLQNIFFWLSTSLHLRH